MVLTGHSMTWGQTQSCQLQNGEATMNVYCCIRMRVGGWGFKQPPWTLHVYFPISDRPQPDPVPTTEQRCLLHQRVAGVRR